MTRYYKQKFANGYSWEYVKVVNDEIIWVFVAENTEHSKKELMENCTSLHVYPDDEEIKGRIVNEISEETAEAELMLEML